MKRRSFTGYTARAVSRCVLIALVSTFTVSAQTDAACRQKQFAKFSEWSTAVSLGPVVNSNLVFWPSISPNGLSLYFGSNLPGGIRGAGSARHLVSIGVLQVGDRTSSPAEWIAVAN